MNITDAERAIGLLFGKLFAAYDDEGFKRSVELFERRFRDAGFDPGWFKGKQCLDAGCGGGRYSIALAHLGASSVDGIDLGEVNIADARRRAAQLQASHVNFHVGSVGALPFANRSFDAVVCSGVLQHTAEPIRVLDEMTRVLRPGGLLYMLVYATEGLRWPLVQMLRPIAASIGFEALDSAVAAAGLPVNRRRTYLDDLFVHYIDFYSWQTLRGLLSERGFEGIERWQKGRLDHEETIAAYATDLRGFLEIFEAAEANGAGLTPAQIDSIKAGTAICRQVHGFAKDLSERAAAGQIGADEARRLAIGQGHHRLIAWKGT